MHTTDFQTIQTSSLIWAILKVVPFIGSGVSLTYDQTNVRAKTSVTRYTAFPLIDEENDYQCMNSNSNDSNNLEFGFEMLFILSVHGVSVYERTFNL